MSIKLHFEWTRIQSNDWHETRVALVPGGMVMAYDSDLDSQSVSVGLVFIPGNETALADWISKQHAHA
jgi:hypothetical protein